MYSIHKNYFLTELSFTIKNCHACEKKNITQLIKTSTDILKYDASVRHCRKNSDNVNAVDDNVDLITVVNVNRSGWRSVIQTEHLSDYHLHPSSQYYQLQTLLNSTDH